jgi:hypothetical protein
MFALLFLPSFSIEKPSMRQKTAKADYRHKYAATAAKSDTDRYALCFLSWSLICTRSDIYEIEEVKIYLEFVKLIRLSTNCKTAIFIFANPKKSE